MEFSKPSFIDGVNPPPKISTPQEAPWKQVEALIAGNALLVQKLDALIALLSGVNPPPGPPPPVGSLDWQNLPDVIAAKVATATPFAGLLNPQSTILARMTSPYEEYGTALGGSLTTLTDTSKNWQNNIWAGHTVFIWKQGILYPRSIFSNTNQGLAFATLPTGVVPDAQTVYWIQPPVLTPGATFVTGQQTVASAGPPVRLSLTSVPVRSGTRVTVISKPGNTGAIYFANSLANCVAGIYFDGLDVGLAAQIAIDDVMNIWIDAANDTDGASWYAEQ